MSAPAPSSSSQALACIAAVPAPARVRSLLEAIHAVAVQLLAAPLQLTLVELERELFKQAERARSSQMQADLYAEMRQLREHGTQFVPHLLDALAVALAELKDAGDAPDADAGKTAFKTMTLVADNDIDRDIVLHEIARREAIRAATPLQLLSQRFGVLAARPAFEVERLPVGPHVLCRVLREAGEKLQLGLDAQIALYGAFERQTMERYGELIDRINILLAHEGVLPGLVYQPYLPKAGKSRRAANGAGEGEARRASTRPLTSWQGQAPRASWSSAMAELGAPGPATQGGGSSGNSNDGASGGGNPGSGASGASGGSGSGDPGALAAAGPFAANPTMSALHDMLGAARGSQGAASHAAGGLASAPEGTPATGSPSGAPPQPVPSSAILDVLGKLQAKAAGESSAGARRSIGDIHTALLTQMRAEHGPNATLAPQDTDTLDLLGMLYTQIQREVRTEAPAADLLVQLQVPVVRAAISDQAFFVRDQHPARELLNAVAESGATWLSEEDTDPGLLQKLGEAVTRVVSDYQGDESVFAEANQEVQGYLRAAARKAEVAERRHVEAARGKERLEAAKQLAARTINELCEQSAPPKFVQTLLREAWTDVLTLTLLRQGEQSDEWSRQQQATRQIAEVTCAAAGGATDVALCNQLEESLLQVGYHRDEAGAIARRLATPGGEDDVSSKTELAAKLKTRSRLGGQGGKDTAEPPQAAPKPGRNEKEEGYYRQLRTLPFGTWFEFVTNQQGDTRRQRLSWYSLITDNALFVNQRGQKVSEQSLDGLSRLMAQGQVNIVTEDKGRLIDRAWQATIRTLRLLSGAPMPESA